MEAGAAGVVAMRYSVYAVTAAQFVAELYGALGARTKAWRGCVVGTPQFSPTNRSGASPMRRGRCRIGALPVVWGAGAASPVARKSRTPPRSISNWTMAQRQKPGALDQALPARPDVGFYGRDETLYALDRAFDTQPRRAHARLCGPAGKTTTAAEFARWYALTGGVEGPVLFTSFERHLPLARVLDKIGAIFGNALEGAGIYWDAITDIGQTQRLGAASPASGAGAVDLGQCRADHGFSQPGQSPTGASRNSRSCVHS